MTKILKALEAAFLIAFIVALALAIRIEVSIERSLPPILAAAQTSAQKFSTASDALADAARQEDAQIARQTHEVDKTVADAHDLLIHTDISLNGRNGLLPGATSLLADQRTQLAEIEAQAQKSLADLDLAEVEARDVLTMAGNAASGVATATNDPRIEETIGNLDSASQNASQALLRLNSIAASGDRDAQMLEKRLREALKPASVAKSLLYRALGIAGPAAQIATAAR